MRYLDARIAGRALLLLALFGASHDASARQSGAPAASSPAAQSSDAALVASIAGEYEAESVTIVVTAQPDGTLTLLMPGQPLYHLQQQVGLHYFIKELPAFAVEFARDASGAVAQMQVIQPPPQQNFVAVRKRIQQAAATQTTLTPTLIASLAGEYEAGSVTIVVTAQPDGTLTLLMPGQPLYHLQQQVGLHYFIKELPAFAVEFARDASGALTQMHVIQPPPQQNFVAVRKKTQQAAATQPMLTPTLIASLAGEYEAGAVTIVVTAQPDGTLTLLMPGQPLYHLQQQVGLHYFIKELPAFAVEFARDASGAVAQMQVTQPPPQQNFVAVRKKKL